MANEVLKRDQNHITVLAGVTDDASQEIRMFRVDPVTGRLKLSITGIAVSATVDVGTTTTGAAGTDASVVNSGTTSAAIFDFTIPRGDKGDQGDPGAAGPVGMTWEGTYNAGTAYDVDDAVAYNGSSYICIQAGTGQTPDPAGTAYWSVLALKGSDGAGSGDISGSGTANEIAYFTAEKTIASLAVATYPSLTELSYVKGVTSAIQSQFTGKAATGQTFYIGTTQVAINRASAALTLAGITLTTPDIGVAVATSINKVAITAPATGSTLTIADGKTLTVSNTITFTATDGSTLAIGTGGTLGTAAYTAATAYAAALSGTINEIAYFNSTTTIASLAVATYPSLTELSYVKGVTSAIQTQLGTKSNSASPTFTGTLTLADNTRIDLTLPTADTYVTGNTTDSFASGYSSAVGDLVFFGSGGKWLEVDSDAVATCQGLIGIALEAKADTEIMKVALPGSFIRLDSWNWTVGATLYAGETLGAMQETIPTGADAIIKVVGFAVSADVIFFNPSPDQQSTVA